MPCDGVTVVSIRIGVADAKYLKNVDPDVFKKVVTAFLNGLKIQTAVEKWGGATQWRDESKNNGDALTVRFDQGAVDLDEDFSKFDEVEAGVQKIIDSLVAPQRKADLLATLSKFGTITSKAEASNKSIVVQMKLNA